MIEARLYPNAIRRKNAKSEESSSPRVDERRCSNNEDDGKSKVGRRQDRKSVAADSWCHHCHGRKTGRFTVNACLNETATGRRTACRHFHTFFNAQLLRHAPRGLTTA